VRTVLDATVLIDHLRKDPAATAYLHAFDVPPLCSEVTRIELHRGVRSAERRAMEATFELINWVAVDESISRRAGELGRQWRASHPGISSIDLAVAATAQAHLAMVATSNVRHFPMFPGAGGAVLRGRA